MLSAIVLPNVPWDEFLRRCRQVEELGFDALKSRRSSRRLGRQKGAVVRAVVAAFRHRHGHDADPPGDPGRADSIPQPGDVRVAGADR